MAQSVKRDLGPGHDFRVVTSSLMFSSMCSWWWDGEGLPEVLSTLSCSLLSKVNNKAFKERVFITSKKSKFQGHWFKCSMLIPVTYLLLPLGQEA